MQTQLRWAYLKAHVCKTAAWFVRKLFASTTSWRYLDLQRKSGSIWVDIATQRIFRRYLYKQSCTMMSKTNARSGVSNRAELQYRESACRGIIHWSFAPSCVGVAKSRGKVIDRPFEVFGGPGQIHGSDNVENGTSKHVGTSMISIPLGTTIVLLLRAMRYEWHPNVIGSDEHPPRWIVDTEHGLMLLCTLISLFWYTSWRGGCCESLAWRLLCIRDALTEQW